MAGRMFPFFLRHSVSLIPYSHLLVRYRPYIHVLMCKSR